jgi:hypothetical protein
VGKAAGEHYPSHFFSSRDETSLALDLQLLCGFDRKQPQHT